MLLLDLGGKWRMKRTDQNEWIGATVPGSVYSDLLSAGKMEDPFFRENEKAAFDLCRYDYEYQRSFDVDAGMLSHDRVILRFEGLDTVCDVYLNGTKILYADDMHRTYRVDVRSVLTEGENTIRVVFCSPINYCLEMDRKDPVYSSTDAIPGISHLRKAHCMFGWDWGPKLPDMGIWRSVTLRGYDCGRIDEVYVNQKHQDGSVDLDLRVGLEKWTDDNLLVRACVTSPDGESFVKSVEAKADAEHLLFHIENPALWWPNNLGGHPLYDVVVTVSKDGRELDSHKMRVGLRSLRVKREKDEWGESFAFEINGTPIFAMGADYIPEDNLLARVTPKRTERLIKSCVEANYNTIRIWGGGYYLNDFFYDLCDENGLIVWQDMMYACNVYRLTGHLRENILAETVDNVKRLRHHACLGLWCGNNEQEAGWSGWGWSETQSPVLKTDYIKMYEVLLPELMEKLDPDRLYWPSSPSSGGSFDDPNGQKKGDMHYWEVWHGQKPFTAYREIYPRFMSEFGLQSFPELKTVETFTLPGDRNIFTPVMESHQKNSTCNGKILYYISENYRYPKDFDSLLYASQLIQAEGLRYGVEHWRRNRGRCMGSVYWQLNDCWPVASWASIDYFGRWKALHYAAKRFYAPVLASACEEGTDVALHVSNESRDAVSGRLEWRLMTSAGKVLESGGKDVEIQAFSTAEAEKLDFSGTLDTVEKRRDAYLDYRLKSGGETLSSGTVLFVKSKHFNFMDPHIAAQVTEENGSMAIRVKGTAFARFVELSLSGADAVFSDNYFDLNPGEEKIVYINPENLSEPLPPEELKRQLRIRSLFDSSES